MSARLMCLTVFPALLVLLSACSKLSVANYERIEVGMRYEQVTQLIGKPERCDEALGLRSCMWGDEARHIRVNFVAGKAVLFSAQGLK